MKLFTAVALVFLASVARAEVKAPGSVIDSSCAREVRSTTAKKVEVCWTSIVGHDRQYVRVGTEIWVIKPGTGPTVQIERVGLMQKGLFIERLAADVRVGYLNKISEDVIELTFQGHRLRASKFEALFHTM